MGPRITRSQSSRALQQAVGASTAATTTTTTRSITQTIKRNPPTAAAGNKETSKRPASPIATNIPPKSLNGDSPVLAAYPGSGVLAPPLATIPQPSTTASGLLNQGLAHLRRVEPKLGKWIDDYDWSLFTKQSLNDPINCFESLATGIISQQITGAAATTIKQKFIALFNNQDDKTSSISFPTPELVLTKDKQILQTAGLSKRKSEYMHSLAEAFENGTINAELLRAATDQEIIDQLTKIRGIGAWSAEMFLIFHLKRMDVFSVGDLGIQRGMAAFAGRDITKIKNPNSGTKKNVSKYKYMSETEMWTSSEKFRPYRSLFCLLMWRVSGRERERVKEEKERQMGRKDVMKEEKNKKREVKEKKKKSEMKEKKVVRKRRM